MIHRIKLISSIRVATRYNRAAAGADLIFIRPQWYLSYVKNLAGILKFKYNLPNSIDDNFMKAFNRMTDYGSKHQCSLRGVIDTEIAMYRRQKFVDVLRYDVSIKHPIIFGLETFKPTLYEQYIQDLIRTKDYLRTVHNKEVCEHPSHALPNNSGYRIHFFNDKNCSTCPD